MGNAESAANGVQEEQEEHDFVPDPSPEGYDQDSDTEGESAQRYTDNEETTLQDDEDDTENDDDTENEDESQRHTDNEAYSSEWNFLKKAVEERGELPPYPREFVRLKTPLSNLSQRRPKSPLSSPRGDRQNINNKQSSTSQESSSGDGTSSDDFGTHTDTSYTTGARTGPDEQTVTDYEDEHSYQHNVARVSRQNNPHRNKYANYSSSVSGEEDMMIIDADEEYGKVRSLPLAGDDDNNTILERSIASLEERKENSF